uniref:Uncharacterized protein n=1 Tax=Tanacetum cinerariifolium TaxID=118510 RepID=A0A699JZA3_TANCI|nr:hypothetical protein [Tanacetum cinerariifolium]
MSTPLFVNLESSTQADGAQSSRVPTTFPEDPYEAIRQAYLVEIDTEYEPFEDPIDTETPESPYAVASLTSLSDSTPPACHTEELEDSDTSGAKSTSSDSIAPLSPDHPLARTSPTPTPTYVSFHCRTARMTVCAQPVMSPGHSARVAEAMALSDSALRRRYRSSYETSSSSSALPARKRYLDEGHGLDDEGHGSDDKGHRVESDELGLKGEKEVVPEGQQRATPVVETVIGKPLGLGYGALRHRELAVEEDQTPPSLEWSSGLFPVLPAPSVVPSPISSPMISLTIPSPTSTATILVDEDQFIEIEAQLEIFRGVEN